MTDWIHIYEDVLPPHICAAACAYVDAHGTRLEAGYKNDHEVVLGEGALLETFREAVLRVFEEYKRVNEHVGVLNFVTHWEPPVILKYAPGGQDHFAIHADCWNPESATRQVSAILYLNDVERGGETHFPSLGPAGIGVSVPPRRGRMLVFPSFWMFPHLARAPESGPKYAAVIWLCFPPCKGVHYGNALLKREAA